MANITKCTGQSCNKREFCYRFTAIANKHRQACFSVPPIDSNGECDEYWEMKCPNCGQYNGIHKLSCKSGKITVTL